MTNESQAKLQELLQDVDFSKKVLESDMSPEELEKFLEPYGVYITADELRAFNEEGAEYLHDAGYISEDGELTEKALEEVAGGRGGGLALAGVGAMGIALASDYCAGAFAVALVSNPVGWFFGGMALLVAGAWVYGQSKKKKRR